MIVEAVLDSGALMAYVHGVDRVGELLFRAAEDSFAVAIPSTCLIEAYQALSFDDEFDMLRVLRLLPVVLIDEPQTNVNGPDDLPIIGGNGSEGGPDRRRACGIDCGQSLGRGLHVAAAAD